MSERDDKPTGRAVFDPAKVKQLLGTGGGLLGELTDTGDEQRNDQAAERWLGVETGPYRISSYLDRGGMSLVFRAERCDGQFEQQVAIKVLRTPDAAELAQRFARERQLLARLEHPGIAHIIDSGIVDGQPWIAMELIDGVAIDQYCDQRRLNLDQRLDLFVQAARAVQFAHGRLIVHRDLKPSNILVNAAGQAKLLDFGIAKALQSDGNMELTGPGLLLTPMYASPEQVLGEPVGLGSDIYQLGLLLYRLLTGSNAQELKTASVAEIKSVVVDRDPLSPSTQVDTTGRQDAQMAEQIADARSTTRARLHKRLNGDLDAIVLHALEKEPAVRYATVQSLIDDIEAYRHRRPIAARPAGRLYQMKRFAQRNWGGVTAVGLVALALIGGTALASLGMFKAQKAEAAAESQAARAQAISDFMVDVFDANDPRISGDESLTAKAVLENAVAKVDEELDTQPLLKATMLERIGAAHAQLGLYEAAEALLLRALRTQDELPADPVERANVEHSLGRLYLDMGRSDEAVEQLRSALEARRGALAADDPDTIVAIHSLGLALAYTDQVAEGIELIKTALDRMPPEDSDERSAALYNLGFAYRQSGNSEPALPLYLEAIAVDKRLGKQIEAAEKLGNVGMLHMEAGRFELAKQHFREQLAAMEPAFGDAHPDLITPLNNLAHVLNLEKNFSEALPLYRRAQAISEASLGPDHLNAIVLRINIANVVGKSGQFEAVLTDYRSAVDDLIRVLGAEHYLSSRVRVGLSDMLLKAGAIDEARQLLSQSERQLTESVGPEHAWTAQVYTVLAQTELAQGRLTQSLVSADAALAIQDAGEKTDPFRIRSLAVKAAALNELGQHAEASEILQSALALTTERYGSEHATPLDLQRQLCRVELDAGQVNSAQEHCQAALSGVRSAYPELGVIQVAETMLADGLVTVRISGCAKALGGLREALQLAESIAGADAFDSWPYRVAYADCLNEAGEHDAALAQAERANEVLELKLRSSEWQRWVVDSAIAESTAGLGQGAEAAARMKAAAEALRAAMPESPQLTALESRAARMSG